MCNKVSLHSPVRGGGTFALIVSGSIASIDALVLLQVELEVEGPSAGDALTELMRMVVDASLFPGISTSLHRQSAALLQAPDIHSKGILYVADSTDH